eukprot:TRINITY_DN8170_c0_g1_i1.p1 TRINITY_DN8170_c0_g1~~TRINITY_DN8170_c0_g1_i1.p1  ORF type:complete len:124 (+),score=28.59 TRINITY_DN8170_c0_g1_i1:600-971(+)
MVVDESTALALLQCRDQRSVLLAVTTVVALRLQSPGRVLVIFVFFMEYSSLGCFDECIELFLAAHAPPLRRQPVTMQLDGTHVFVIGAVDKNEVPKLFVGTLGFANTPHMRDGRVRLTHAIVF